MANSPIRNECEGVGCALAELGLCSLSFSLSLPGVPFLDTSLSESGCHTWQSRWLWRRGTLLVFCPNYLTLAYLDCAVGDWCGV